MHGTPFTRDLRARGQTFVEAALFMPMFLLLVFLLLQIGHLGIAMAIVNYGASSVAHQAVTSNGFNQGDADQKFKGLLAAGLQAGKITHSTDGGPLTPDLTVTACAELQAYPFVGPFLDKTLSNADGQDCAAGAKTLGPVALKGPPYTFVIQGTSRVRMNYNTK